MAMKDPIIGITLDEENADYYSLYPWYAARKNYAESIDIAGGTAIFLPHNIKKIPNYLDFVNGLVITGGDFDIDPKIYGKEIESENVKTKTDRTNFEFEITKQALKREKPVLGICGGQQLLNVVLGGTLIQHIPDSIDSIINHEQENPRDEPSHIVKITQNTKLHKITKVNEMYVNSAHHQSVDILGKDLIVNSIANDGIIEGIENPNHKFCIGVQWHPEFLIDRKDIEIFKALVESSR